MMQVVGVNLARMNSSIFICKNLERVELVSSSAAVLV